MSEAELCLRPAVDPAFEVMRDTPGITPGHLPEGLGWSFLTFPFNLTGQPAASVPCGFTRGGLPVGLQVVGRRHDDTTVQRASAAFEAAVPWQHRQPTLDD